MTKAENSLLPKMKTKPLKAHRMFRESVIGDVQKSLPAKTSVTQVELMNIALTLKESKEKSEGSKSFSLPIIRKQPTLTQG